MTVKLTAQDGLEKGGDMQVVLDPGHGGTTVVGGSSPNNAIGPTGLLEKDVTLEIALMARDVLGGLGITCRLTRTTDVNVGLADRAHVARDERADAFVSIHFNASDAHNAQGTETWIHNRASPETRSLAHAVQAGTLGATGYRDRGVKQSAFAVLNPGDHSSSTSACLVEVSFMDIAGEEARLRTANYKSSVAQAVAQSIYGWLIANGKIPLAGLIETTSKARGRAFPEDGFEVLAQEESIAEMPFWKHDSVLPEAEIVRRPPPPIRTGEDLLVGEPVDVSTIDPSLVARLTFDGYKLRWHGAPAREWSAFSGAADDSKRESEKDVGPTPQGHYTVDPADIEYLVPGDDWGSHRVRLQPLAATVDRMRACFKLIRTGMYLHGGDTKGTHGCIELNHDSEETSFFDALKDYGRPIDLEVKYTGAREAAYEEGACPY